MDGLRKIFGKIDLAIFQIERALLVLSLGMMTLLVSADVVQRTFSRPEGKTASLILAVLGEPSEATRALVVDRVGPALFGILSLVFCVLAVHARRTMSAKGGPVPAFGRSALAGVALWGVGAALIQLLLKVFPTSVPGAQRFALGFMLWSGMVGASLATRARRHIMLDTVVKKLTGKTQQAYLFLSGVAAASFCALLAILGTMQVVDQIRDWASGDGVGVYEALPIPTWIATLSVPFAFWVMAARFLALGVHDLVWGPPKGGVDAHGVDLEALAAEGAPAAGAEGTK